MPDVRDIMEAGNQCAGMSPRSAVSDDIAGGSPPGSDDETGENLNDRQASQPSESTQTVGQPDCLIQNTLAALAL